MAGTGRLTCFVVLVVGPSVPGICHTEKAGVRATIDQPATLVALPRLAAATAGHGVLRIVVAVVGYTPASDGPVEAVVTVKAGEGDREVGHISIFPQTAFDAAEADKTQRFAFPLPDDVVATKAMTLTITLKAAIGTGKGASFVFGGATLER